MPRRIERLNEQMKREITEILRREAKDPRVAGVTASAVEVTSDLSYARVYVLLPGAESERQERLAGLRAAAPFIRSELGRRLRVRRVPELQFEPDLSLERALRIERLLEQTRDRREGDDDV